MERVILHSDLNNFYASVECLYNPSLRGKPVAVAGDPEARHGIVLAKNYEAKACGVATGNPLWMAKQKCPDIIFVPPHYDLYMKYSQIAKEIYSEYTDQVEPYGLDECWLDVTGSTHLFGDGPKIANELRKRIKFELGVTASVGVSYNKIFAKLGSDMKKPDATTIITSDHFRDIVWPLPVNDLLYVGRATHNKLKRYGIQTIGDLAQADQKLLRNMLGQNGLMLWMFANGLDTSPVSNIGAKSLIKSIGNSATAPRDLITDEDIRITLMVLCESVSSRMREYGFVCNTVQLGVRDNELCSYERQGKLSSPNRTAKALLQKSFELYKRNHTSGKPVRSLSVRACNLSLNEHEQLSFLPEISTIQKQETLESAIDNIRNRFGHFSIQTGLQLSDKQLSSINPKDDDYVVCGYLPKSNGMTSIVLGQYADKALKYKGHVTLGVGGEDFRKIRERIMCGRYSLFDEQDNEEIGKILAEINRKYPTHPIRTGEIFPTNTVPVLTTAGKDLSPKPLVWGFPKYTGSGVIINARAETAEEKKTFRQSLFTNRCVVPSTGFYEWDEQKKKHLFRLPGEQTLYMAGICKEYDGIQRYVILTTSANNSMKAIHDRMPVILPKDKILLWATDTAAALDYLHNEMPELVHTS